MFDFPPRGGVGPAPQPESKVFTSGKSRKLQLDRWNLIGIKVLSNEWPSGPCTVEAFGKTWVTCSPWPPTDAKTLESTANRIRFAVAEEIPSPAKK